MTDVQENLSHGTSEAEQTPAREEIKNQVGETKSLRM
jgi:hypothetical protein